MLEEPHHPDMIEVPIRKREGECVGLTQRRLDAGALEVPPREVELLLLDVHAVELDTGELLSEHCQHCAHAGADFEQARPRLGARCRRGSVGAASARPAARAAPAPAFRNRERTWYMLEPFRTLLTTILNELT